MALKRYLIIICLAFNIGCYGQDLTPCKKASRIIEALNNYHIQPPAINDGWSERVFDEFFNLLDPSKRFLTVDDLNSLASFKFRVDDALADNNCMVLDKATALLKKKLTAAHLFIASYLKSPLDFSKNESVDFSNIRSTRSVNQSGLEAYWQSLLKLQVLLWMSRNADQELSKLSADQLIKLEQSARQIVLTKEQGSLSRLLNPSEGFDKEIETNFLKAVSHSFDPHTEYFTPSQHKDFTSSLATSGFSFGVEIEEDFFGQIKISKLIPGGPAWLSNELTQGDIVIGVTWQGQPPIDILLYDIDELEHDLNAANKSEVTLTVKGINGQIKTVSLTKGKIELNENTIKSFLLKGTKSIGYISLPGFYTQFEDHSNKGCANDIARELIKLKKEKIDGLILDLRFNGGGSLYEALSLAGIFIDAGPVALMQETGQPVVTLKDLNRGTIYDGPLVIMVNGFSASASELVSAVLQDLNRAIIVGKQTYGKATGQVIMPIDKNSPERSGYLKVTNERIYRITGKSLQKKGVSPDIFMPDFLESITERERDFASALNADSVVKKSYYTPLPSLPIAELSVKSKTRIATAKSFASIQQAENIFSQSIPLQLKEFAQYNQALDTLMESLGKLTQQNLYQVQQNRFDNSLLSIDDHKREINEEVLKEIQHSVFIEEAYLILLDYLLLLQPNQK